MRFDKRGKLLPSQDEWLVHGIGLEYAAALLRQRLDTAADAHSLRTAMESLHVQLRRLAGQSRRKAHAAAVPGPKKQAINVFHELLREKPSKALIKLLHRQTLGAKRGRPRNPKLLTDRALLEIVDLGRRTMGADGKTPEFQTDKSVIEFVFDSLARSGRQLRREGFDRLPTIRAMQKQLSEARAALRKTTK